MTTGNASTMIDALPPLPAIVTVRDATRTVGSAADSIDAPQFSELTSKVHDVGSGAPPALSTTLVIVIVAGFTTALTDPPTWNDWLRPPLAATAPKRATATRGIPRKAIDCVRTAS